MKITSIHYEKVFPIAPYQNEKIGVEIQVDEDDDTSAAYQFAKSTVQSWYDFGVSNPPSMKNYSIGKHTEIHIDKPHTDEVPVIQSGEDGYVKLIWAAKSMEELAAIKLKMPRQLTGEYMQKMKELTQQLQNGLQHS